MASKWVYGLAFLLLAGSGLAATPAPKAPGIYDLPLQLRGANGRALALKTFRGRPLIVTMFFARCVSVCPTNVQGVRRMVEALQPEQRARVRILLLSFDPDDSPKVLQKFAQDNDIDRLRWHIATVTGGDLSSLDATLGADIRRLPTGDFAHQPTIAVFDAAGDLAGLSRSSATNGALLRLLKAIT